VQEQMHSGVKHVHAAAYLGCIVTAAATGRQHPCALGAQVRQALLRMATAAARNACRGIGELAGALPVVFVIEQRLPFDWLQLMLPMCQGPRARASSLQYSSLLRMQVPWQRGLNSEV
jgi:hypothetical protein